VRIEDLPIDFFATATNLTKSKLELQLDGPLWAAVRASASLPAILPPMLKYGQLYLDGGLLDNTPARSMRAQGAGRVIAVDVSAGDQSSGDIDLQHMMSSQGVGPSIIDFFRRKVFKSRAPTIADIVVRSMVIGSREQAEKSKALADLYIRMPVDPWKMLDFKATPALVRLGYDYAVENMPEWQNKILPRATLKN
jgi:NTE family protein